MDGSSQNLAEHDFIGEAETSIGAIVGEHGCHFKQVGVPSQPSILRQQALDHSLLAISLTVLIGAALQRQGKHTWQHCRGSGGKRRHAR